MKRVLNTTPALLLAVAMICPEFAVAQTSSSPFGRLSVQQEKAALETSKNAAPVAVIAPTSTFQFAGWTPVANMGCLPSWDATVDGSDSTASHGRIVKYDWTWATGPGFPTGKVSSPTPTQTLRMIGNRFLYTVNLTVTDKQGKTGTTAVNVTTPLREEQAPAAC